MHKNSLKTYGEERYNLNARSSKIYEFLRSTPHNSNTDRQIMERLGFNEPNQVRPRITELIKKGLVFECGSTKCPVTNKTVRLIKIRNQCTENQMDLF